MFDTQIRRIIDPALNKIGRFLAGAGISANTVSWAGFAIGMIAALSISNQYYGVAALLIIVSRICDGLDGAVARVSAKTDLGGYLDIVLDFAFYGAIPLAFIIADPASNWLAGSILLFVFYVNGASFLTYALMAEKRGVGDQQRGSKSLLYTTGLAEGSETIALFIVFCALPDWFSPLALGFAVVTVVTTISRFVLAYENFK